MQQSHGKRNCNVRYLFNCFRLKNNENLFQVINMQQKQGICIYFSKLNSRRNEYKLLNKRYNQDVCIKKSLFLTRYWYINTLKRFMS